jgi:hypothetical protein
MGRKSKTSRHTDSEELGFSLTPLDSFQDQAGAEFSFQDQDAETHATSLTLEQIDERERRLADQVGWQEARMKARDGGFVTEVIGSPADLEKITNAARKRLALFSRDRQARDQMFEEFAAAHADGPIVFLPAEAVLDSERLLETLHIAVCSREGLPITMPVEDVITWLGARSG